MEEAKKNAAVSAVRHCISAETKYIGIGSGSTIVYVVQELENLCKKNKISLVCVPTSFQSQELIERYKLPLGNLCSITSLDIAIDGADEVDCDLNCIKGGGGCMTQEKVVASCAKRFIVVADHSKDSTFLGEKWKRGIPIEVLPFACKSVIEKIKTTLNGNSILRIAKEKAGPIITDNGNFILDVFFSDLGNLDTLNNKLLCIPGIIETGLFLNIVEKVFFGMADGSVSIRSRDSETI